PEKHTTGPARDMIGAVAGLLTLLCALVTGLLIWTAYGVYAGQTIAIQTLASKVLQLDLALADYGPEATAERAALRDRLGKTIDQVWGTRESDANFAANSFASAIRVMRDPEKAIGNLQPSTDQQRQELATAKSDIEAIGQSRLQMSFALTAPVSYPLLLTVVGWVFFLFVGFGLMSRGNLMSVMALAVGAVAVASAVLLILDLSNPYSGVFRASAAPLEQVLAVMGKE
uniref:bestrophin-like domain n=1 Tax=Roseiarcus sp. TaxID=1969460 RepID=UPI003F95049C